MYSGLTLRDLKSSLVLSWVIMIRLPYDVFFVGMRGTKLQRSVLKGSNGGAHTMQEVAAASDHSMPA
jgi:hypothetical protein